MPDEIIKEDLPQEDDPKIDETPIEEPEQVKEFLQEGGKEPIDEEEKVSEPDEEKEKPAEGDVAPVETPPQQQIPEKPLEEVVEDVVRKTTAEILKDAGVTKEEMKEEDFKFVWEERGEDKPATWREQAEEGARFNQWLADKKQKEIEAEASEKAEEDNKRTAEVEEEWGRQLGYLREKKYIPEINPAIQAKLDRGEGLTAEEAEDPGVVAQRELFMAMGAAGRGRPKPVVDLVHIYHEYYKPSKQRKQPPGANAPVSAGTPSVNTGKDEDDLTYPDLKKMSFEDIVRSG